MRISDWSSDVCSSDLAFEYVTGGPIDISDPVAIPRPTGGVPVGDMSDPSITDRTRLQSVALSDQLSFLDGKGLFTAEFGRALGRERVCQKVEISVVAGSLKKKTDRRKATIMKR